MTAQVANAKQGLDRRLTYTELIKEIDKDKFKTNEIRKVFDRNAWFFHESPLNPRFQEGNFHPPDAQQMNFKRMAYDATAMEEEDHQPCDYDGMDDLRDDAVSDFEMTFDRERDLRDESQGRVAEQANFSHAHDHYRMNKGAYDAVGATASAGIRGEEPPHSQEEQASASTSRRTKVKNLLKSSKPLIKAVATATGTAKGGNIGGLIASKLTDTLIPDDEVPANPPNPPKPPPPPPPSAPKVSANLPPHPTTAPISFAAPTSAKASSAPAPMPAHQYPPSWPKPPPPAPTPATASSKAKPVKKAMKDQVVLKAPKPKKTNKEPAHAKMDTDVSPPDAEPEEAEKMDASIMLADKRKSASSQKPPNKKVRTKAPRAEKREMDGEDPTTVKPPKTGKTKGKQQQPQQQAIKGTIKVSPETPPQGTGGASSSSSSSSTAKAPPTQPARSNAIYPKDVGVQVIREKLEELSNQKKISSHQFKLFTESFQKWKNSRRHHRVANLEILKDLYAEIVYPKIK